MKKAEKIILSVLLITIAAGLAYTVLGIVSILRAGSETSFPWSFACFMAMIYFGPAVLIELVIYIFIKYRGQKEINNKLLKLSEYFLYFLAYSIIGWCYEVFLETIVYKWGFTNRGVLFGPYCPVYGFGMLLFIFTVYRLIKNKPLKTKLCMIPVVVIGCALTATAVELLTSYICEFFTGSWPWQTYADYKYNFQARIALSPSIRFGLGGALFLYLIQPLFERAVKKSNPKALYITFVVTAYIVLADFLITIM